MTPASPASRPIDCDVDASANFGRPSRSHFLVGFLQTNHPCLANYNTVRIGYSVGL